MITLTVKKLSRMEASIGLICKNKPEPILFKTHFGIHTFLLKFPIDVVILDGNYRIVKIKENLKPNSLFVWNPLYDTVVELPQGAIKEKKMKLREKVIVKSI